MLEHVREKIRNNFSMKFLIQKDFFLITLIQNSESCKENEEYTDCGPDCYPKTSCFNKDSKQVCFHICIAGCFCAPGYVLDHNELCIPESECPMYMI